MNRFPRYSPPFQYYNPYRKHNFYSYNQPIISEENKTNNLNTNAKEPITPKPLNSKDNVWFDLFGIKLYFDDVLILSLLFFLYKEEVKDEGLFFALVLLLIS